MARSMRRSVAAVAAMGLVAGGALLGGAGLASAAEPVGGCAPGFRLELTSWIPSQGTFYGLQAADLNGDGWSCVRLLPQSPTELAFTDNRVPLG